MSTTEFLEQQYAELTVPAPEPGPADWNDNGFVIKKDFFQKN